MHLRLIYIISITIISFAAKQDYYYLHSKQVFQREFSNFWNKEAKAFYKATQIGTKRGLKKVKNHMKNFGIIHLLTPSGIHLGAITFVLKSILPRPIYYFFFVLFTIYLHSLDGFYSLKRICYFFIIKLFTKSNKISFIATFIIDLVLGGFINSPMSYGLSLLFWGIILFSKKGIIGISFNLFIAQLSLAAILKTKISFLSLIINPIFTSFFSFVFPYLSFQYWINAKGFIDELSFDIISLFLLAIKSLDNLSFTLFIPSTLIIFLFGLNTNFKKVFFYYILLFHNNLNYETSRFKETSVFYEAPCNLKFHKEHFYKTCKKKPSTKYWAKL